MNSLDTHYLFLQFSNMIFMKNGTEFQSFFENIMEKAFPDYQKIKPYGNKGDGGNDGYLKTSGIYYQVYAPIEPKIKESEASKKLTTDFEKLQNKWDSISSIKEYNFVFNDKYSGSTKELEKAISELKQNNPRIEFKLFLAKDLEKVFLGLEESVLLRLGFNIDKRQAVSNAFNYLETIKKELDRENLKYSQKILENVNGIIANLNDEKLSLEYEILECSCLRKQEKVDEAKEKYESLTKRFPQDTRAILYLAEIYLIDKNFDKNLELLQKAEKIDSGFWLLTVEQLVRKIHLGEKIDLGTINENNFPDDPKIKSSFYRFYALFFENENLNAQADSFIEKSIHLDPERCFNYVFKLLVLEKRLLSEQELPERQILAQKLMQETKRVEDKFFEYEDIGARNRVILNSIKLTSLYTLEQLSELEKISKEIFNLSLRCYFDGQIEQKIITVLQYVSLPNDDLSKLIRYIISSVKGISDELSRLLIFQFNINRNLLTDGKQFFTEINTQKYLDFIKNIEDKNDKGVLNFLKSDISFAIRIASTLLDFPELRKQIIEDLPIDEKIQKEKLLLQFYCDENDFDKAFSVLKTLDLSKLSYLDCKLMLKIVQKKNAWDFEVIILQKLIEKEKDEMQTFHFQFLLFNAYHNLKQYRELIEIGKELLTIESEKNLLDTWNKEVLIANTILACLQRGKVDGNSYVEAEELLEKYKPSKSSFEFKVAVETEVYIQSNNPQKALNAIVEGVKIKRILSAQEYANLFFLLTTRIGNQTNLELASLEEITEPVFVKLKNTDQWYFIGDDNELDAIKVSKESIKYSLFEKKKLGDQIVFEREYGSKRKEDFIEYIFPIDRYIFWNVVQNFRKLSNDGDIEGVSLIEVPQKGDSIDLKYMLKMMEDTHKITEPLFEMYLKNNIPLAVLAVSEGGITNAIGRIQSEQKGFIHFSNGTIEDFEKQKEIARSIIQDKIPFYLDGTSALFISEIGYLEKIYKHIPNIKSPQSVINLLGEINERFTYTPGQSGHIGYSQGKINHTTISKEKRDSIKKNIINSVRVLESTHNNIEVISSANKIDCFSEKQVPAELNDACILAQKYNLPIMTEDYKYLEINEIETKKKAPQHFSSIALLRVLYEENLISFDDYLEYFGYLSSYRFRFLQINSYDIELAVFGNSLLKTIKPENIRMLNFPLTLSEEYGVPFQIAFSVVRDFLLKILLDNTVIADIADKIFIEILESFPYKENKKDLGELFLGSCINAIEKNKSKYILQPNTPIIKEKFDKLLQAMEIYYTKAKLWGIKK